MTVLDRPVGLPLGKPLGGPHTINAFNVNDALQNGLWWLWSAGFEEESRNGPVLVSPGPVITNYLEPDRRVLFWPKRDANPYFHFMEAMWMLAGRNDVEWLSQFSSNIRSYSDDGQTFHGAYGFRWRKIFGHDQLLWAIDHLRNNPNSRQCAIQIFGAGIDQTVQTRDVPCNLMVTFDLRGDKLNMTVFNRSNDIVWGLYGANAVHFGFLQEYMAMNLNVPMGLYRVWSNNYHLYIRTHFDLVKARDESQAYAYAERKVRPYPIGQTFDAGLLHFMRGRRDLAAHYSSFFANIAVPLWYSWMQRKSKKSDGMAPLQSMPEDCDWRIAAQEWIARREAS